MRFSKYALFVMFLFLVLQNTAPAQTINIPPSSIIIANPPNGPTPLQIILDGNRSFDPDGSVTSFQWDFGDGTSGQGAIVGHTYNQDGRFSVTLTVTDNKGTSSSSSITILAGTASSCGISTLEPSPFKVSGSTALAWEGFSLWNAGPPDSNNRNLFQYDDKGQPVPPPLTVSEYLPVPKMYVYFTFSDMDWNGRFLVGTSTTDVISMTLGGDFKGRFSLNNLPVNPPNLEGIAWDGKNYWINVQGYINSKPKAFLLKVNPQGIILQSIEMVVNSIIDLLWDGVSLWGIDDKADKLHLLDKETGAVRLSCDLPVKRPRAMTWDGVHFWILDGSGTVHKLLVRPPDALGPNFEIIDFQFPLSASLNQPTNFTVKIKNTANVPASQDVKWKLLDGQGNILRLETHSLFLNEFAETTLTFKHTFATEEQFTIEFSTQDDVRTSVVEIKSGSSSSGRVVLPMNSGWNTIFNGTDQDLLISDLQSMCASPLVVGIDRAHNLYTESLAIKSGVAYLLRVAGSCQVTLTGNTLDTSTISLSSGGWQFTGTTIDFPASLIFDESTCGNVVITTTEGDPAKLVNVARNETLKPFKGYLIRVDRDCQVNLPRASGRVPVIIIPGFPGSELYWDKNRNGIYESSERYWPDAACVGKGALRPVLRLDSGIPFKAVQIIKELPFTKGCILEDFFGPDYFGDMIRFLIQEHFIVREFPYDWRHSNRDSAQQLAARIEEVLKETGSKYVDIVAHSNGGLIARYYINLLSGGRFVRKLIMLGTPNSGSAKPYKQLNSKLGESFGGIPPSEVRWLMSTFLTPFEILPPARRGRGCILFEDFVSSNVCLDYYGEYARLGLMSKIEQGENFWSELDTKINFEGEFYAFAGRGVTTEISFSINSSHATTNEGDGTVTVESVHSTESLEHNLYITLTGVEHSDLVEEPGIMNAIKEILISPTPTGCEISGVIYGVTRVECSNQNPSTNETSKSIEESIDENENGLIDDREILSAIKSWVLGQAVAGNILDDITIYNLVRKWITGEPIS